MGNSVGSLWKVSQETKGALPLLCQCDQILRLENGQLLEEKAKFQPFLVRKVHSLVTLQPDSAQFIFS